MWVNFKNRKRNVPPAAHVNSKCHDVHVALTLDGDKWAVVRLGSRACSYGICLPLHLFCFLFREKLEMEIVREDVRESQSKEVGSKLLKEVPSHKRVRVHVKFNTKHLIIERRVWVIKIRCPYRCYTVTIPVWVSIFNDTCKGVKKHQHMSMGSHTGMVMSVRAW